MKILDVKAKTTTSLCSEQAEAEFTIKAEGTKSDMQCFMETVGDYAENMCDVLCGDKIVAEEYHSSPIFGGAFYNEYNELVYIKKVVYNKEKRTVAVVWSDDTTTTSKCVEGDTWNKDVGLLLATMKKVTNSEFTAQLMMDWSTEEDNDVVVRTIKEVRQLHKALEKVGK